eukprot:752670-Hanusia_phi.AAC.2
MRQEAKGEHEERKGEGKHEKCKQNRECQGLKCRGEYQTRCSSCLASSLPRKPSSVATRTTMLLSTSAQKCTSAMPTGPRADGRRTQEQVF